MRIKHFNRDEFEDEKGVHLSENFHVNYEQLKLRMMFIFLAWKTDQINLLMQLRAT